MWSTALLLMFSLLSFQLLICEINVPPLAWLCQDFDSNEAACNALEKCVYAQTNSRQPDDVNENNLQQKNGSLVYAETKCLLNPKYIRSVLAESTCQTLPKASLLAISRDLVREKIMSAQVAHHLRSRTDTTYICYAILHSYAFFEKNNSTELQQRHKDLYRKIIYENNADSKFEAQNSSDHHASRYQQIMQLF